MLEKILILPIGNVVIGLFYYFTPTRMAIIIIFKKIITNVENDRENWNSHIADGNVKWYRHFKKY